jgi:signal transduction histidine kinase
MSFRSLRLRLLIAGAVSILIALGLAAFGLTLLFERHVERRIDAELTVYLNQLVANLTLEPSGELAVHRPPADPRFEEPLSGLYWQIDIGPAGKTLRSRSLWDSVLTLPPEREVDDALHHYRVPGPAGEELYLLQKSIELPPRLNGSRVRVAVAWRTQEIRNSVRDFASELVPFLILIGLLLIAASWAQVTIGLRPLAAIRRKLGAIRSGHAERLLSGFPSEVQPLAEEIDGLLDAREKAIERAKARAADLAHGLKTPLQVLNGEIERLKGKGETEIASDISSLADAMRRHVDRELARARLSYASRNASANLKSVVDRVVRVVERTPQGQKLDWDINVGESLTAPIETDDLSEALGNLIENSVRHARTRISISAGAEAKQIFIVVADDGPGIAEEHRSTVLARGERLDTRSEGAGLGLAIVSDIAEAAGGRLILDDANPGLIAKLQFPADLDPPRR